MRLDPKCQKLKQTATDTRLVTIHQLDCLVEKSVEHMQVGGPILLRQHLLMVLVKLESPLAKFQD